MSSYDRRSLMRRGSLRHKGEMKHLGEWLSLAEVTVRNHIRGILVELGVHSQLEAVAKAREWRLV